MRTNHIYKGDALKVLKRFPDESIDMCITSPPYWALRDYGMKGQLGLEKTFQEYINKLCDIFDEVRRVLKPTGTCWVNIGDTYGGSWQNYGNRNGKQRSKNTNSINRPGSPKEIIPPSAYLPGKSLIQIPSRFAIEMTNRGWILRNEIIWMKPNCMPSSVSDRFTVDFEKLFFFTKNKKYWFETQYEPHLTFENRPHGAVRNREYGYDSKFNALNKKKYTIREKRGGNKNPDYRDPKGRNKRAVWKINTKPYPEAHFAVYPEKLIETPIKAGCPEFTCRKCGFAREKIIERGDLVPDSPEYKPRGNDRPDKWVKRIKAKGQSKPTPNHHYEYKTIGLTDCKCNAGFEGGTVLDIFMGSGTTARVAMNLKRQYIGIDLNTEYIKLASKRTAQKVLI